MHQVIALHPGMIQTLAHRGGQFHLREDTYVPHDAKDHIIASLVPAGPSESLA